MIDRAKLFKEQMQVKSDESTFLGHSQATGIYDPKQVAIKYPPSPVTGLAQDDLSMITSPLLTQTEKDEILSRLNPVKGSFMPSSLSDEELMSLVPPRYFTEDPVDVQNWRTYLGNTVFKEMQLENVADDTNQEQEEEQEQTAE